MDIERGSHCIYQIRYHMVLCVKYRKRLLATSEHEGGLVETLREIGERYEYQIDDIGSDGDHVHVFVGAAGRWSPSRIMQVLKSVSARQLFDRFPKLKKQLWGGEFWSDGGYIGTVGDGVTEEIIRKYIRQQGTDREKKQAHQLKLFR